MIQINASLCQSMNPFRLLLFYYGRAQIDSSWHGKVYNPVYSRLFYIVSGRATIKLSESRKIVLTPGNWYLLPAGCSFEYACDDKMDHVYFHLKLCGVDGIDLFRRCPEPCSVTLDDNKADFFIRGLSFKTFTEGLKVRQEAYSILLAIIEKNHLELKSKNLSPCVTRAVHYIKYNPTVQLTTKQIAEHAFVSVSTLTKHFKSELSISVHDYIYDQVLFEAEQLVIKSDLSILEISEKFGFCDQFYFSRRFREKFGMSPTEYRKTIIL